MNDFEKLNDVASKIIPSYEEFSGTGKDKPYDLMYSMESVQVVTDNTGPFSLNAPRAPIRRTLDDTETRCTHDSVIRILIGLKHADEIVHHKKGYDILHEWFTINRYEFLKVIQGLYGNMNDVRIEYVKSGVPNQYFTLLENSAAYEFRVYARYIGK